MHTLGTHNYYIYILTNYTREVMYVGVTNNLERRIQEHKQDADSARKTFAGKYNCFYLVYFERYQYVQDAIRREKELKGWKRSKKDALVISFNPEWKFLNDTYEP